MKYFEADNVFEALGSTPAEAHTLRLRSTLMMELESLIKVGRLSTAEAAIRFDVEEQVIEKLMAGQFECFSLDDLVRMLAHAGILVQLTAGPKKAA